jgi:hypothetical protein
LTSLWLGFWTNWALSTPSGGDGPVMKSNLPLNRRLLE